jgi:TldD protein
MPTAWHRSPGKHFRERWSSSNRWCGSYDRLSDFFRSFFCMKLHRRQFVQMGATALAATALSPRSGYAASSRWQDAGTWLADTDPDWRSLAAHALDAASGAGAQYADLRFRVTRLEDWDLFMGTDYPAPETTARVGVGVRVLIDGYWGFAGMTGLPTPPDMARLGQQAATQAGTLARGKSRRVELAPTPVVTDGRWIMPVQVDPFTVPWQEKVDYIDGMSDFIARQPFGAGTTTRLRFAKDERIFASTDNSFFAQTVFTTGATMRVGVGQDWMTERFGSRSVDFLTPAGAGWEYVVNAPFEERAYALVEEARRSRRPKPVELGRYDVVFDAVALAGILDATIGPATELDRAMGYEANNGGTSFLNAPLDMLGTYRLASPLVTVMANRSMPGGAATVKWDDEGVEPDEFTLVKDGVLTDFQTTRESASWMASYYQKIGRPLRSHGCAGCDEATIPSSLWPPNFVLAPGVQHVSFDDLVAETKKGLAVVGGQSWADQQALNGTTSGDLVYEIRDGKLGQPLDAAEITWRAPEFWRNVVALGGAGSVRHVGMERGRDYAHRIPHTVAAVPAKVTQLALMGARRRA